MKILITYGTRYGSTAQISQWMKERMPSSAEVSLLTVSQVESVSAFTHVIIGSPLYDNDLLPEVKRFIAEFDDDLYNKHMGVFGVALSHLGRGLYGEADGGLVYFNRFFNYLPTKPIYSRLLGGALHPELLNDRDRKLLEAYYRAKGSKQIPFEQEMDKEQVWEYVEKYLDFVAVKTRLQEKMNRTSPE